MATTAPLYHVARYAEMITSLNPLNPQRLNPQRLNPHCFVIRTHRSWYQGTNFYTFQ